MKENEVKNCLKDWLEKEGYTIAKGTRREDLKYTDIRAHRKNGQQWRIEVKGDTKNIRVDFLTGLGQIITRMENPPNEATRYALAVPDSKRWQKLISEVPYWIKKKLKLRLIFVNENGKVKVITPSGKV